MLKILFCQTAIMLLINFPEVYLCLTQPAASLLTVDNRRNRLITATTGQQLSVKLNKV